MNNIKNTRREKKNIKFRILFENVSFSLFDIIRNLLICSTDSSRMYILVHTIYDICDSSK